VLKPTIDPDAGTAPTFDDVKRAAERIRPHVHRTPVVTCASLDRIAGASLFLKCENLQKVGAFKARGATNAVLSLSEDEARRGVATHSSGNHAAALARAASIRGVPAHVVMPLSAPPVKRAAVEGYGARITECEPTLEAREATLADLVERTGATFIHPYDDPVIIAGQGTAALELVEDVPNLDAIIAPVGGGGLLSGTSIVGASSAVEVYGAEPKGADDAFRSLRDGTLYPSVDPRTVCDGLLTSLSELTFSIIREHVAGILTVSEEAVIEAMRLIWSRAKLVVEPSAAVTLAAVLEHGGGFGDRRLGLILSGGNVDLDHLPWTRPKAEKVE
jgi:threonine dehydratase